MHAHPLSLYSTITYKAVVYAPAGRGQLHSPYLLYPYMYYVSTSVAEVYPMTSCVLSDLYGAGGELTDELTVPAVH